MEARITNYGGIIMSLSVPDRKGTFENIVLGFDDIEDYKTENYLCENPYLGAIVGRYANVIASAKFSIDGICYQLNKNFGNHCLHGGIKGFDQVVWESDFKKSADAQILKLSYLSADGEEGFPGNLNTTIVYELTQNNELIIKYSAKTDKKTIVNLTNHSYFNLSGAPKGNVLEHELCINSTAYVEFNKELVPTGKIKSVKHTPMNFMKSKKIGEVINSNYDQLQFGDGYDVTYVLKKSNDSEKLFAGSLFEEISGRLLEVFTTTPGLHLYTGNSLNTQIKKDYTPRSGICFETQYFPDSPNHLNFPSCFLEAGEEYDQTTIFRFSVKD